MNNLRIAIEHLACQPNGTSVPEGNYLELPDGLTINSDPVLIQRQNGEIIRGMDVSGARIIEQIAKAG